MSTPLTPLIDNHLHNLPIESRHSNSLQTETRYSEFSSGARLDQEINNEDTFLQQESSLVSIVFAFNFFINIVNILTFLQQ